MRQLREDFLLDLEEAVAARDARQIMRLIRQYNLEKQQRTREHELGKKERSQDLADELADIERQRQIKKQERAIELSDKLSDIARDAAYERQERARENVEKIAELKAEAELKRQEALREFEQDKADLDMDQARRKADRLEDYGREMDDLKRHHLDRQVEVLAGLIQEYNITESMLKTINDLMLSYYGPSGAYMQTLIAFYTAWSQMASSVLFPNSTPMTIQKETTPSTPQIPGYAKGGTILATKPTVAMFGEEEPEFVTITPLSKMGKDASQMLSGVPGTALGQTGGKVEVALWLSPDLESRIVNATLNETAKAIVSINKLKVQKGI